MTKVKLSSGEVNDFAHQIAKVLMDTPLFYVNEVMEIAMEARQREGKIEDLDVSSDEESGSDTDSDYSSAEEDEDQSLSDNDTDKGSDNE